MKASTAATKAAWGGYIPMSVSFSARPFHSSTPRLFAAARSQLPRRVRPVNAPASSKRVVAPPPAVNAPNRRQGWAYITTGFAAGGLGVMFISYYNSIYKSIPKSAHEGSEKVMADVSDRFDRIADQFDGEVGSTEFWMGISLLRRWLMRSVRGDVLEVAVGTGRNVDYYDLRWCRSVTMVDQSAPMVELARKKWEQKHPGYKRARFITQSALQTVPAPTALGFDTIVQTMGLCSTPEPEELLRNMGRMLKDDGRIILLEHGRSHYKWLNDVLDKTAPAHADKLGCYWNKDIGKIVEKSGLEVVKLRRYHFGTTWWVELKPGKDTKATVPDEKVESVIQLEEQHSRKPWWRLLG